MQRKFTKTKMEDEFELACKKGNEDRWYKELISRLIKKTESIEKARNQITKLLETKKVLLSNLDDKDEEIYRLNCKVLLLLRQLSSMKTGLLRALEEIKMLKNKNGEPAHKNKLTEQHKHLSDKLQVEPFKSQKLLTRGNLKTPSSEELRWQAMEYTDPHYFELLQRKNHLQRELQKKLDEMKSENVQLCHKNTLVKNLHNALQRKPFNLTEDTTEQMMEFYKTIQLHKKKMKMLTAQVNMFGSVFANQHYKLP